MRSIFKFSYYRADEFFKRWVAGTYSSELKDRKEKVNKFIACMNESLKKNTNKCFIMPSEPKSHDTILSGALLAICKNLVFVKNRIFHRWAKANVQVPSKLIEYLLRNLAKYPKMNLICFFSK